MWVSRRISWPGVRRATSSQGVDAVSTISAGRGGPIWGSESGLAPGLGEEQAAASKTAASQAVRGAIRRIGLPIKMAGTGDSDPATIGKWDGIFLWDEDMGIIAET